MENPYIPQANLDITSGRPRNISDMEKRINGGIFNDKFKYVKIKKNALESDCRA